MGHLVGYARVSTKEQNPATQQRALRDAGCERVFVDHGESSRHRHRPQWDACLDYLRRDDTVVVYRLDRIAGSTSHLIEVISALGERGINIRSLTEPEIDTTTPMGRALYGIVAVFAQLRVDTIRQNTRDGLAAARARGRVGGRPTKMTEARLQMVATMRREERSKTYMADALGVGRATIYRALDILDQRETDGISASPGTTTTDRGNDDH